MEVLNKKANGHAAPIAAAPLEKRSCPRYPFSPEVEVVDIQSDTRLRARLSDISRNGCYVDTINPFPKDSPIRLSITRDNISFKTQGKVAYSNLGMGMGVLFTTAEPDQLQSLGTWLTELSGGKPSAQAPPVVKTQTESAKNVDTELRKIFGDLVAVLNGKKVLNDSEAMALLRKLSR